jgi:hypothetical protein
MLHVQIDETYAAYVAELDAHTETQQWEGDLISWEFDHEELQAWRCHLKNLLNMSSQ